MNTKTLIASCAFALAGVALGQDVTIDKTPFVAQKSRADVIAEARQALASGERLVVGESDIHYGMTGSSSERSRAAVRAEIASARERGELGVNEADVGGSMFLRKPSVAKAGSASVQ